MHSETPRSESSGVGGPGGRGQAGLQQHGLDGGPELDGGSEGDAAPAVPHARGKAPGGIVVAEARSVAAIELHEHPAAKEVGGATKGVGAVGEGDGGGGRGGHEE